MGKEFSETLRKFQKREGKLALGSLGNCARRLAPSPLRERGGVRVTLGEGKKRQIKIYSSQEPSSKGNNSAQTVE